MDSRLIEFGARLTASKHWRPMVGMVDDDGRVVVWVDSDVVWLHYHGGLQFMPPGQFLPDLSQPATRGCVLQMVRDAWGDLDCFAGGVAPGWWQCRPAGAQNPFDGDDEAMVLTLALEGAP